MIKYTKIKDLPEKLKSIFIEIFDFGLMMCKAYNKNKLSCKEILLILELRDIKYNSLIFSISPQFIRKLAKENSVLCMSKQACDLLSKYFKCTDFNKGNIINVFKELFL
jgi:hypothetical protein